MLNYKCITKIWVKEKVIPERTKCNIIQNKSLLSECKVITCLYDFKENLTDLQSIPMDFNPVITLTITYHETILMCTMIAIINQSSWFFIYMVLLNVILKTKYELKIKKYTCLKYLYFIFKSFQNHLVIEFYFFGKYL